MVKSGSNLFYICIIALTIILLDAGCSNRVPTKNNTDISKSELLNQKNQTSKYNFTSEEDGLVGPFSELTYEKFMNIYNSIDQFTIVSIDYMDFRNLDASGEPCDRRLFSMGYGSVASAIYINSIVNYEAVLDKSGWCPEPGYDKLLKKSFESALVNDLFNYISQPENRTYFFNGEEHEGKIQPYWASSFFLTEGNYMFTLAFLEPNSPYGNYYWMISKSTDTPDNIWNGLIAKIEANFINQFENP